MFFGKYQEFSAFGDTVEVIWETLVVQIEDRSAVPVTIPEVEDVEYFQCYPVAVRNAGYQFVDPETNEMLG